MNRLLTLEGDARGLDRLSGLWDNSRVESKLDQESTGKGDTVAQNTSSIPRRKIQAMMVALAEEERVQEAEAWERHRRGDDDTAADLVENIEVLEQAVRALRNVLEMWNQD